VYFAVCSRARPNPGGPDSAIPSLISLQAFLLVQLGAAVIAEQEKGIRPIHIVIYVLLGLATIVAMAFIVGSVTKHEENGVSMYKYHYAPVAVRFGKWILAVSLIVLLLFGFAGALELLPNQSGYVPRVSRVGKIDGNDGALPRLAVEIPISPYHFSRGVPFDFDVVASLPGELAQNLRLYDAEAYIIDPAGKESPLQKPTRHLYENDGIYRLEATGAFKHDASYILRLRFRLSDEATAGYDEKAKNKTMKKEERDQFMEDFGQLRDKAIGEIKENISIRVEQR